MLYNPREFLHFVSYFFVAVLTGYFADRASYQQLADTRIKRRLKNRYSFLESLFKENRKDYEEKWDNLKLFINYGMLSETTTFYDRAKDFALLKDTEGKYFTFDEYRNHIKDNQTDKDGQLIYLYATNVEDQYTYIEAAKQKDYSVLVLDGQLDVPAISLLEEKFEKSRFVRVDSDIIERIIVKKDATESTLSEEERDKLSQVFRTQIPKLNKANFNVEVQSLGVDNQPVLITQNEYMRRMKDMSRFQSGMGFYQQMPDSYTLVLNSDHELVRNILADTDASTTEALKPIESELKGLQARLAALRQAQSKKKQEEITQEERDDIQNTEKSLDEQREKKTKILSEYAKNNQVVHQLIDLALLQNGMLKGASLDAFLKRSIDLIK